MPEHVFLFAETNGEPHAEKGAKHAAEDELKPEPPVDKPGMGIIDRRRQAERAMLTVHLSHSVEIVLIAVAIWATVVLGMLRITRR